MVARLLSLALMALVLLLPRQGQAQLPAVFRWQHTYGGPSYDDEGYAVPQNGGYLLAGSKALPVPYPGASPAVLYFVQTDAQGDTLWTKQVRPPNNIAFSIKGLVRNQAGTLMLTGLDYAKNLGVAVGLDANCVPLWWTTRNLYAHALWLASDSLTFIEKPLVAADDNFLVVVRESSFSVTLQAQYEDQTLVKLSAATGAQLWAARLDSLLGNPSYLITWERAAIGLLAIAASADPAMSVRGVGQLKLSDSGNFLNYRTSPVVSSSPYAASRDAAGNILVAGRQRLTKLSPQGDTLWHTDAPVRYGWGTDWDGIAVKEDLQGNYVLLGKSASTLSDQVHLVRFQAATGQVVSDTILGRGSATHPRSLLRAANGEMVVSGYAENGPHGGTDLFIFQYRGFGPLATSTKTASPLRLQVYPNPAEATATRVTVSLPARTGSAELILLDMLGRVVRQQPVAAGASVMAVPMAGLPPGWYVLRLATAHGQAWATKFQRE